MKSLKYSSWWLLFPALLLYQCGVQQSAYPEEQTTYVSHYRYLDIPYGQLPPPGYCRVWYPGRPAGLQPRPVRCSAAPQYAPRGAYVVSWADRSRGRVLVKEYDNSGRLGATRQSRDVVEPERKERAGATRGREVAPAQGRARAVREPITEPNTKRKGAVPERRAREPQRMERSREDSYPQQRGNSDQNSRKGSVERQKSNGKGRSGART